MRQPTGQAYLQAEREARASKWPKPQTEQRGQDKALKRSSVWNGVLQASTSVVRDVGLVATDATVASLYKCGRAKFVRLKKQ